MTTKPERKTTRFVLYSEARGVYLGESFGSGLWSKGEECGMDDALAFDAPAEAMAYLYRMEDRPLDLKVVPVQTAKSQSATAEECVAAGLPKWE
jgi:hypothetical protein